MNARTARAERAEKLKRLEQQQKAQERKRKRLILMSAAGVVVVAVAVVAIVLATTGHKGSTTSTPKAGPQIIPAAPTGAVTVQAAPKSVTPPGGITGLLAWDTTGWPGDGTDHAGALEHNHVDGPVTYAVIPPVGGPHNPTWMNAGVYTKPIPSERAVHNLEHGAVWITYNPNLSPIDVAALTKFVTSQSLIAETGTTQVSQSNRYIDMSPWATNTLPSPIVISAWGYQLRVTSPTDPRLQQFIDMFRHNAKYSPEYGSAVDGVPVLTGGQAAYDGGTAPNPAGAAQ